MFPIHHFSGRHRVGPGHRRFHVPVRVLHVGCESCGRLGCRGQSSRSAHPDRDCFMMIAGVLVNFETTGSFMGRDFV